MRENLEKKTVVSCRYFCPHFFRRFRNRNSGARTSSVNIYIAADWRERIFSNTRVNIIIHARAIVCRSRFIIRRRSLNLSLDVCMCVCVCASAHASSVPDLNNEYYNNARLLFLIPIDETATPESLAPSVKRVKNKKLTTTKTRSAIYWSLKRIYSVFYANNKSRARARRHGNNNVVGGFFFVRAHSRRQRQNNIGAAAAVRVVRT